MTDPKRQTNPNDVSSITGRSETTASILGRQQEAEDIKAVANEKRAVDRSDYDDEFLEGDDLGDMEIGDNQ